MSENADEPQARRWVVPVAAAAVAVGAALVAAAATLRFGAAFVGAMDVAAPSPATATTACMIVGAALLAGACLLLRSHSRRLQRQRDEQAQRREHCERVLRACPDGMCLIDADFVIREPVSPSLFGVLQRKLWPGMNLLEALRPMLGADAAEALRVHLRQRFAAGGGGLPAGPNPLAEIVLPGSPSRPLQLGFRFEPVRSGERVAYLLVIVGDIGERLRLAQELAGTRLRLRGQLDGLLRACAGGGAPLRGGLFRAEAALRRAQAGLPRLRTAAGAAERRAALDALLEQARTIGSEAASVELELLETPARQFERDLAEFERTSAGADARLAADLETLAGRIAALREFLAGLDARVSVARASAVAQDTVPAAEEQGEGRGRRVAPVARRQALSTPPVLPALPAAKTTPSALTVADRVPAAPAATAATEARPASLAPPSPAPAPPSPVQPAPATPTSAPPDRVPAAQAASLPPTPRPIPERTAATAETAARPLPPLSASSLRPPPTPLSAPPTHPTPTPIAQRPVRTPAPLSVSPPPPRKTDENAASPASPAQSPAPPVRNFEAMSNSPKASTPTPTSASKPAPTSTSTSTSAPTPAATSKPIPPAVPTPIHGTPDSSQARTLQHPAQPPLEPQRPPAPAATTAQPDAAAAIDAQVLTSQRRAEADAAATRLGAVAGEDYDPAAWAALLALSGDGPGALPADKAMFGEWGGLARRLAGAHGKAVRVEAALEPFARLNAAQAAMLRELGMELVANAVLHGIESMSMRRRIGKDPVGLVRLGLSFDERAGWLLCVRDDGRGVNLVRLRAALVRDGGLSAAQAAQLSERETILKAFEPGITTAPQAEGASGRGLGLPSVLERLRGLNARVSLATVPGRSTEVRIAWPAA